jgi:hypothetical protein
MLGSDIGHFDVKDMRTVIVEAHELVEHELMTPADFRDFAFANAVRLHGGMNGDFFAGTVVEAAAADVLSKDPTRNIKATAAAAANGAHAS